MFDLRKNIITKQFLVTILVIFSLQAIMLIIIFSDFFRFSAADIKALSLSNLKSQASQVEEYLSKGGNVLWFACDSVDYLLKTGSDDKIEAYLSSETKEMQNRSDRNFTGLYGVIGGKYMDGSGWIPPEDYDPYERDWYRSAIEAGGETVLTSPYLDVQTGQIVVSYCRMLSDGESVLSLDIVMDGVQKITEEMTMGNMGYGFIVDSNGLVVAHSEKSEIGKNYNDDPEKAWLMKQITSNDVNEFEMILDGVDSTVFTDTIERDWHVFIVVNNNLLYSQIRLQVVAGVLISTLIFAIIVLFSLYSINKIIRSEEKGEHIFSRMEEMNENIIRSLASTIDAKDRYTSGHSQRVADYAVRIAKKMGKSEEELKIIYFAGLLHDVGKIRVSEAVINKPGKLNEEEFDAMRVHPVSGYDILAGIHDDVRIGYAAKYHHERYDGKGYPNGLVGEDIPEIARIIAVADSYDAMASDRSYRSMLPQDKVRTEILNGKGTQFDPKIADIMLQIIDEDNSYELRQKTGHQWNILVVDDEQMNILEVKHIFKDMDEMNILTATDRKQTMELLSAADIDLILLDLKMPDVDGFTLYEEIRKDYSMPVILMTGDRSSETLNRIIDLKIDDYLTKPLNAAITREAIHGLLHKTFG